MHSDSSLEECRELFCSSEATEEYGKWNGMKWLENYHCIAAMECSERKHELN